MGLFDDKVVVITGAGRGLGREYALAFAKQGAKVVVNDLGGERDGSGQMVKAVADEVVNEIKALAGDAVPNYDSVASMQGAENIIKTAVDAFGRLDVLVNNAGILRDKTIVKMTEEMWDIVIEVHLKGTFACCKAAALQFLRQGSGGRIINTSSLAGLKGNFGQTNYSAAKAGIAGITRTLALELGRKGITVNCIAPLAKTRMTDDIDMIPDEAKPELVAPMVLYLASDMASGVNGRIFGVHGNHIFEYVMEMTDGVDKKDEPWTPQEIHERIAEISMTAAEKEKKKKAAAPAVGEASPEQIAFDVLTAMSSAFLPDKAGSWNANMHFDIADAGKFTMKVSEGKCTVNKGFTGDATCVVNMGYDTFMGMAKGEIDGNQAFMQGKIKATNMKDMIKYGFSFDAKKAQEAVKKVLASAKPSAGGGPKQQVLTALNAMITAFLPDKAGDWKANLHFDIADAGQFTMKVADGKVSVEEGFDGEPTCVVKMGYDTFMGMASGEIDGNQAFMQGKIKATNMRDMIKYGTSFDAKKSLEAVKKALAGGEKAAEEEKKEPEKPKPEGLNREMLGRTYRSAPILVKPADTIAYAEATNDPNPFYVDKGIEGGIIAPVMFPVRLMLGVFGEIILDPELNLDLMRLLHGEQDMYFHEPIYPMDVIYPTATISKIEDKSTGQTMDIKGALYRQDRIVAEVISTLFIRAKDAKREKKEEKPQEALPEFIFEVPMQVKENQTYLYADASGDHNPIHVDESVAKAAGFKGVILHGLCSMAFASRAVIMEAGGGDPRRLKRLKARFKNVVYPLDTITTQGYVVEKTDNRLILGYRAVNQEGKEVITNGIAELED